MRRRAWVLVVAVAVAVAIGVGAGAYTLGSTKETVNSNTAAVAQAQAAARAAKAAAARAEQAISDVQASRIAACESANNRFRATLREIDREVRRLPPAQRRAANANSENTRKLIKKLTGGDRNCAAAVGPPS